MKRRSKASGRARKTERRKAATPKRAGLPKTTPGRRSSATSPEIEIARAFRERDEALEREKATSEVLRIISSSPGRLELVFQAMLESAVRICEAKFGVLYRFDGTFFHYGAEVGAPTAYTEFNRQRGPFRPQRGGRLEKVMLTKKFNHIADDTVSTIPGFAAKLAGARTQLIVPMLKTEELVGAIIIYRQEVRPFTDKQIELVKNFAAQAVIAIENARLLNELRQSLEQQTATADVLRVISSSRGELEPVFRAMLENATHLCDARFGILYFYEDGGFRIGAIHNAPPAFAEALAERERREPILRPGPLTPLAQIIATKQVVHEPDFAASEAYKQRDPAAIRMVDIAGGRTLLNVPMLNENELIGNISIYRQEVRPFTDKQIELVQNFAAQAVIAIENARLLNELRESLQQQTATAEVLKIISSSPGELEHVFRAMLEKATDICDAKFGTLYLCEGDGFRAAAMHNAPLGYAEARAQIVYPPRSSSLWRAAHLKQVAEITDVTATQQYIEGDKFVVSAVALAGYRAVLSVPMLKDDVPIGVVSIFRQEVRPFTDKQIALVQNFAAQAVIAIENTRLLSELRESLQQQTATADVLRTISSSPGELVPVFNSILENATRFCAAKFGGLWMVENEGVRLGALYGASPAFADIMWQTAFLRPGPSSAVGRLLRTKQVVQITDLAAGQGYAEKEPLVTLTVDVGGGRTLVAVPMLKDDELIGAITIFRQEVSPFTDKQIELVQNFAAQAVIAIENTRLLNELRRSLEQQTATADVLRIISSSPGELAPVFETALANATRLCEASFGVLVLREGDAFRVTAMHNVPPAFGELRRRDPTFRPGPLNPVARAAAAKQPVHIPNLADDVAYKQRDPAAVFFVELAGTRTLLVVPMLKEAGLIGAIAIYRKEAHPFSDKHIEVAKNFAAQAVIAIENARLLNELRQRTTDLAESLEQQTATSKVLEAISSSPGDLKPVFDAILQNAVRICGAKFGNLYLREGDGFRAAVMHNAPSAYAEQRAGVVRPSPSSTIWQAAQSKRPAQTADMTQLKAFIERDPWIVSTVSLGGYRSVLSVPMLHKDEVIGGITIFRQEAGAFADRQIELLTNFAAQAVIAIENARLLSELRQRTTDLTESLEQQTATSEVLEIISSSPGDLEPVFRTMLENAVHICEAKFGNLFLIDGDSCRWAAGMGTPPKLIEYFTQRTLFRPTPGGHLDRVIQTKQVSHSVDDTEEELVGAAARLGGARSTICVPMLKDDVLVGAICIYRTEVRPFTDKQIELVQNFAAQAVIAIENTRLLNELRESLQQQTATADVLKIISRSTFDLQAVLNTLVESAARLCAAEKAQIIRPRNDEHGFYAAASYGYTPEYNKYVETLTFKPGREGVVGRVLLEGRPVQIDDVLADPEYRLLETQRLGGFRTHLGLPLLRENSPIGILIVSRVTVQPFDQKQIELLATFADQAVIAIENARLFDAEQQRTRELVKSLEDLRTAQDRLVQTEKLASLGQLTAGIAHEIKNPLNFVNNFSSISVELIDELRGALDGAHLDSKLRGQINEITDMLQSNFEKVVQHGSRADSIVKNMLLHSRQGSGEHRPVDINALVEESLNLAYHGARAEKQDFNITIERSFDPAAGEADLFPQEITRVLLNLISNGFYAANKRRAEANRGDYEPTLTAATSDLGHSVEIRIRDNGTGIPPDVKEKMFNPFFTTKPAGEGTGLGLSISHDIIVKQHNGTIEVDTQSGAFTEFRIVLPRGAATIGKSGENA